MNNLENEPDLPDVPTLEPLVPLSGTVPGPATVPAPLPPPAQPLPGMPVASTGLPVAGLPLADLPPAGPPSVGSVPGISLPPGLAPPGFVPPPFLGAPAMPMVTPKKKRRVWIIVLGVIVALLVLVAGVVFWAVRYTEGVTRKAELAVADHATIGSCWNEIAGSSSEVACTSPHDFEVFDGVYYDAGPYPELYTSADFCQESFETYVGSSFWNSDYDYTLVRPSEESWAEGNQIGFCVIYLEFQGKTTGSAYHTGR